MAVDLTAALDAVEAAFGVEAIYRAPRPGAPAEPVTVIARREDAELVIGPGRAMTARGIFELRAGALTDTPQAGGVLTVAGASWRIEGPPEQLDPDRRVVTLRCARLT